MKYIISFFVCMSLVLIYTPAHATYGHHGYSRGHHGKQYGKHYGKKYGKRYSKHRRKSYGKYHDRHYGFGYKHRHRQKHGFSVGYSYHPKSYSSRYRSDRYDRYASKKGYSKSAHYGFGKKNYDSHKFYKRYHDDDGYNYFVSPKYGKIYCDNPHDSKYHGSSIDHWVRHYCGAKYSKATKPHHSKKYGY